MRAHRLAGSVVLTVLAASCSSAGTSATSPSEVDVEPRATTTSAPSTTPLATDTERLIAPPSPTAATSLVVDLFTALDNGTIDVVVTNGSGGLGAYVDLLIRNETDAAMQVELPSGLVVGDADPTTIDLVLPFAAGVEIPSGSEVSLSIPAYQAAFRLRDPGSEIEVEDFINPAPPPGVALTIRDVDARLRAVLDAAEVGEPPEFDLAAQIAVLATASDIGESSVGVCGSVMATPRSITRGDRFSYTSYFLTCEDGRVARTTYFSNVSLSDDVVEEARDILRIAAGLNPELATPFRIVIRPTSAAFSDEQVRSALVALVDQDRLVELFGFGVTFHLLGNGQIPEGGAVTLPEVTAEGMSQSDAVAVINAWRAANGSIKYVFVIMSLA